MHEGSEGEREMRIAGEKDAIRAAILRVDPEATARRDEATGIFHVRTRLDTLELEAALQREGFEVTAPTG